MNPRILRSALLLWCVVVLAAWLLRQPVVASWFGLLHEPAFQPPPPRGEELSGQGLAWTAALRWLGATVGVVAAFFAANLSLGWSLLPLLVRGGGRLERLVLAFALGTVVTGLALLGLALAGLFSPAAVIVVGALGGGAGLAGWLVRRGRPADEAPDPPEDPDGVGRPLKMVSLLVMVGVGLLLLLRCAIPDMDLDSVEFHRVAINQLLRTGGLDICWDNYAANRPLQLELFQAVAFDDRSAAAAIQALFTWLTGLAVAAVLWRRTGPTLALLCAAVYLLDQSVLWRAAMTHRVTLPAQPKPIFRRVVTKQAAVTASLIL